MNDFFNWDILTTYSGVILAVTIATQFLKEIGLNKISPRIVSYIMSVVIMMLALVFTGTFSWSAFALTFINAIVIALASNGTYDFVNKKIIHPETEE